MIGASGDRFEQRRSASPRAYRGRPRQRRFTRFSASWPHRPGWRSTPSSPRQSNQAPPDEYAKAVLARLPKRISEATLAKQDKIPSVPSKSRCAHVSR